METSLAERILRDIAERARLAVAADRCTIFDVDRDRGEVFSRVALGLDEEIRLPLSQGIVGFVARTGRGVRLRDAYNDPRFDASIDRRTGYWTRAVACVPVTNADGVVIGAIQAINKIGGRFTADDEDTLGRFANEVAEVLEAGN